MQTKLNKTELADFKLEDLSSMTGIGFYTLGRIWRGEREVTKTELIAISSVTGKPVSKLIIEVEVDKEAS